MAGEIDPVSDILGSLKTSRESIEKRLDQIGAKLDLAIPMVTDHDKRLSAVEKKLDPLVEAHNRRLWVRLGWGAALGTTVTSPLWITKLLPFLSALPK